MAREPAVRRVPDDDRVALFPDLSFEEALRAILAVDPRKVAAEEGDADGDPQ